jgi:hypothetical protein
VPMVRADPNLRVSTSKLLTAIGIPRLIGNPRSALANRP